MSDDNEFVLTTESLDQHFTNRSDGGWLDPVILRPHTFTGTFAAHKQVIYQAVALGLIVGEDLSFDISVVDAVIREGSGTPLAALQAVSPETQDLWERRRAGDPTAFETVDS